jgi:hypothetical protein
LVIHRGSVGIYLGGQPSIVATQKIPGWISDSRMAGNNLYLATQNWTTANGSWSEQAILTQISIDSAAGKLVRAADFEITGSWPVISAGAGLDGRIHHAID